jgi:uncharacterized membrane protein YfcA
LIGCIGIGGVLLVPCLSLAGVDVHAAIGASMFSFIFSGGIGVWLYARHGSIEWRSAAWLATGGEILLMLVGATVVFAGWRVFRQQSGGPDRGAIRFEPPLLAGIGAAVGIASAATGTGGPVLLVPLLMWWGAPVLATVGLSQAIQVPIALTASLGNFWTGSLDLPLAALLSIGITLGAAVGARVAHAVPAVFLARVVAVALVLVGIIVAVRSGHTLARTW